MNFWHKIPRDRLQSLFAISYEIILSIIELVRSKIHIVHYYITEQSPNKYKHKKYVTNTKRYKFVYKHNWSFCLFSATLSWRCLCVSCLSMILGHISIFNNIIPSIFIFASNLFNSCWWLFGFSGCC